MTKTLITKWLESTKTDRIDAIATAERKAKEALFEKQIAPFLPMYINKIVPAARVLEKLEDGLMQDAEEAGFTFYRGFTVTHNLPQYARTVAGYKEQAIKYLLNNPGGGKNKELDKLTSQYENARYEINENYTALISNVKLCKSAKDAVDYLESLHLDLTDLYTYAQEMTPHSLALPVNLGVMGLKVNTEKSKEEK